MEGLAIVQVSQFSYHSYLSVFNHDGHGSDPRHQRF